MRALGVALFVPGASFQLISSESDSAALAPLQVTCGHIVPGFGAVA